MNLKYKSKQLPHIFLTLIDVKSFLTTLIALQNHPSVSPIRFKIEFSNFTKETTQVQFTLIESFRRPKRLREEQSIGDDNKTDAITPQHRLRDVDRQARRLRRMKVLL